MANKKNIGAFAENLVRARASAGFDTAYKFYHKNGGKRHFPFTFFHYTRVEKGLTMPAPEALPTILTGLRLLPNQGEMRELLMSYLKDLLGGGAAADAILSPLLTAPDGGNQGADNMKWMRQNAFVHISVEEFKTITANNESYWCWEALSNDQGAWTAKELAEKLVFSAPKTLSALASLSKAGLLVKDRGGKYKCRHESKFFIYPGRLQGMGAQLDAMKGYWKKTGSRHFFERQMMVRTDPRAISNYKLALSYAIDGIHAYATHKSAPDTAFYMVKTEIEELKKF